ncbi:10850_t:CDS:1 [Funneliformis geosporum]|uniref:18159_t:CDS:1 n=1 Tax=Funneliformis geosporum TaxID=1117311 RepID=A0A9W4WTY6_9GLOM|nr:10850_t:CDS:1 [Funneliformis geosporum]CAI2163388.1 18159_t:CDS:1 [Funneliformis geosporum]
MLPGDNIPSFDNKIITLGEIKKVVQDYFHNHSEIGYYRWDNIQGLLNKLAEHANNAEVQNSEIDSNKLRQEMKEIESNKRIALDLTNKPLPNPVQSQKSSEEPVQVSNPTNELKNDKAENKDPIKSLGKEKQNEDYAKEIKSLKDKNEDYVKKIKNLKDEYVREIKSLKQENDKYLKDYNKLITAHNNNVELFNKRQKESEVERMKYEKSIATWRENYDNLDEQLKSKRKEYNTLYQMNESLREEASQYQSALGDARNYRLGDNDANNPTQLTKDIEIIQDSISNFCKIKGGVDINEQHLTSLLEKYKCKIEEPGDKVLLKAALQRYIIETIIDKTDEYLKKELTPDEKDKHIELEVINSTKNYLTTIKQLINTRKGTDKVSDAAPTKISQLVMAVLGDRGFCLDNDGKEHEFVLELKKEIIGIMNNLRTIKKEDKRKDNEEMAAEIIRNVIKMFVFRIKVLEPPGEIEWIDKDAKLDPTIMEVGNLEDDNHEDYTVNLCSFPLIGVSLKSEKDRKVLVPAKIIAIRPPKAEQKNTTKMNKLINFNLFGKSEPKKRNNSTGSNNSTEY